MKTLISIFFLLLSAAFLHAQESPVERMMERPAMQVKTFKPSRSNYAFKVTALSTGFNDPEFDKLPILDSIREGTIVQIDFAYTQFVESEKFNQKKLNKNRLERLYKVLPQAFNDPSVTWRIFEQTAATDADSAKKLFHGFAITWKPRPTAESMASEIKYMKRMFGIPDSSNPHAGMKPIITKTVRKGTGGMICEIDTIWVVEKHKPVYNFGPDTVINAVFKRNKSWKNMQIICDVTGSMSPYSAQLMAWYRLNTLDNKVKRFVFFNDGDNTPDDKKIIGATGGIYESKTPHFDTVIYTMFKAMQKGNGGDTPENNLEAIKYAASKDSTNMIIMIADNWATPKDLELVKEIGVPVHIILCGAQYGINVAYLNLARATGGSVHTMEQDLNTLSELHEGETIRIGKFKYVLKDGAFVRLTEG